MSNPSLLLISPPVLYGSSWWANRIANKPHLDSLAGAVRDLADVRLLELDRRSDDAEASSVARVDALIDDVEAAGGRVGLVGLSCWTSLHYLGTLAVAERVRSRLPDVPIVVGGHHATALPSDFSREHADYVVRGDGENALRTLCKEWPERPDEVRVLLGGVFDQSDPTHIDWSTYGRTEIDDRALWLGTSRGCAFQCRFCVEPQRGAAYSRYSVAATLEILEGLVETRDLDVVAFSDPLFGASRRWTEAFIEGLRERRLPLKFWAQTRADLMTPALLDSFKELGFMVDFGLDTASVAMIERMEKSARPELYLRRYREILGHANAIELPHGVYLVFNFPGETPDTMFETMAFIESIGDLRTGTGPLSGWLSAQTFFILPGTDAYLRMEQNAERYGTEIRNADWWRHEGDHYALATDVLPSREWRGREDALRAFQGWNQLINSSWWARYTPAVHGFRESFFDR